MQHLNIYKVLNLEVSYITVLLPLLSQEKTVQLDIYANNHLFPKARVT